MYLETMLEDYLLELKLRNYSERTIKSARNTNRLYFKWLRSEFGIDEIEQIKKPHIKAYLKYKQEQGLSPVYINGILKYMRMFFRYLVEEEYLDINPVAAVKFQKEEKVIIQSFMPEEVERMIKVYGTDTFLEARNRCIIAMLFDTGIRNFELCSIRCEDIRSNSILIHGKGNKQRVVPISPFLRKCMNKYDMKRCKYIKERYQDEYYFLSQKGKQLTIETVERIVRNCGEAAGVNKEIRCSPHTCRHTFAQLNIKNGLDVYSLSRLMGHENISITKRCLQSMTDADIVQNAVKTSPLMNL